MIHHSIYYKTIIYLWRVKMSGLRFRTTVHFELFHADKRWHRVDSNVGTQAQLPPKKLIYAYSTLTWFYLCEALSRSSFLGSSWALSFAGFRSEEVDACSRFPMGVEPGSITAKLPFSCISAIFACCCCNMASGEGWRRREGIVTIFCSWLKSTAQRESPPNQATYCYIMIPCISAFLFSVGDRGDQSLRKLPSASHLAKFK